MNRGLNIAYHGVDPGKCLQIDTGWAAARDDGLMLTTGRYDTGKTIQAVRNNNTRNIQVVRPLSYRLFAKTFDSGKTHRDGMSLLIGGDSRYKWTFARCALAALASPTFSTPTGIVPLNSACQWLTVITLFHHLHQLALHPPCCIPSYRISSSVEMSFLGWVTR